MLDLRQPMPTFAYTADGGRDTSALDKHLTLLLYVARALVVHCQMTSCGPPPAPCGRAQVKGQQLSAPFPRLTYAEAMERYGCDKPDTRYGLELRTVSDAVAGSTFRCA